MLQDNLAISRKQVCDGYPAADCLEAFWCRFAVFVVTFVAPAHRRPWDNCEVGLAGKRSSLHRL
jgi:hypothetical protein